MTDLARKTLEQLGEWITCEWPRNTYIYGKEGEIYVRWTPSIKGIQARFTIANVQVYEEFRGNGIFRDILSLCCATIVPVIRLECIHNPRLLVFAAAAKYPGRKTIEDNLIPPSVDWILNVDTRRQSWMVMLSVINMASIQKSVLVVML